MSACPRTYFSVSQFERVSLLSRKNNVCHRKLETIVDAAARGPTRLRLSPQSDTDLGDLKSIAGRRSTYIWRAELQLVQTNLLDIDQRLLRLAKATTTPAVPPASSAAGIPVPATANS
ncbi:hypothetical protein MTO96_047998 [Rhipicephalus appendiculatus]